jgi:hypothetical protein
MNSFQTSKKTSDPVQSVTLTINSYNSAIIREQSLRKFISIDLVALRKQIKFSPSRTPESKRHLKKVNLSI